MIVTVRDITRERRMEQEVKRHASRLAAINEIANAINQSLTIENIFTVAAAEAGMGLFAYIWERTPSACMDGLIPGSIEPWYCGAA